MGRLPKGLGRILVKVLLGRVWDPLAVDVTCQYMLQVLFLATSMKPICCNDHSGWEYSYIIEVPVTCNNPTYVMTSNFKFLSSQKLFCDLLCCTICSLTCHLLPNGLIYTFCNIFQLCAEKCCTQFLVHGKDWICIGKSHKRIIWYTLHKMISLKMKGVVCSRSI